MSSRVLRKLHGENDLEIKEQDEQISDIETDIGSNSGKKKQFNLNRYDLLNQQSPSESEVKEDDNETEHASATSNAHACEQAKKKKKKRKKKSGKQTSHRRSSEDNADIDDLKREVDKLYGESYNLPASPITASTCTAKSLLSVQHKNLNPSYEMKRMFGSRVVQAEQNKRRNVRGPRPLKSTWLVNAKENWPPVGKTGVYMTLVQPSDKPSSAKYGLDRNVIYFQLEHSTNYRQLEQKFLTAVESMESDNIIQIIDQQPYHVDSLIQLSEMCKMSEDHAMASELIEHALLALESSFHSVFSLTNGNCRLDYRRQENRCFFIVLFKHAQYLESRACSRTALEVSKLILSLDPDNDPLAMILILDFYAIRAKQNEWLIQLYNEWEASNNLSQLPNMAYSYALALFHVHKNGGNISLADKAIQYALLMFPSVLRLLLDELSIQVDSRVSSHNYFGPSCLTSQAPGLQQLTSLYVTRSKLIWRDGDILPWLEKNVTTVLDMVDAKDEIINEYTVKRSQRYLNPPRPILRHVVLSDFKEKVPLAQFLTKEEPILMYDPLPPSDSINIYNRPNMSSSRIVLEGSPFSMFFQSLLPSFNLQQGALQGAAGLAVRNRGDAANNLEGAARPEGDDAAGYQSYAELRNSLNSLMDAMRDFLVNVRPNDADVDENDSSEDEVNDNLT